jgi:hypothetical protein
MGSGTPRQNPNAPRTPGNHRHQRPPGSPPSSCVPPPSSALSAASENRGVGGSSPPLAIGGWPANRPLYRRHAGRLIKGRWARFAFGVPFGVLNPSVRVLPDVVRAFLRALREGARGLANPSEREQGSGLLIPRISPPLRPHKLWLYAILCACLSLSATSSWIALSTSTAS